MVDLINIAECNIQFYYLIFLDLQAKQNILKEIAPAYPLFEVLL